MAGTLVLTEMRMLFELYSAMSTAGAFSPLRGICLDCRKDARIRADPQQDVSLRADPKAWLFEGRLMTEISVWAHVAA